MPIAPRSSIAVGLDALRANPLRALLSTLGVVMGVGAMVSVLAMSDGVERFGREQIARTTDLLALSITPNSMALVDSQWVRRADPVRFAVSDASALSAALPAGAKVTLVASGSALATWEGSAAPRGFALLATPAAHATEVGLEVVAGRFIADQDEAVVVLGDRAAAAVAGPATSTASVIGQTVRLNGAAHRVIGVVRDTAGPAGSAMVAYVPLSDVARALPTAASAALTIIAPRIEDVDPLRLRAEEWLAGRYGSGWRDRVTVRTNRSRVEQMATGMRIFRLLMGAITGVSLLVGGIGIMNVLLASVAERTREIGIRKAAGARDRDILAQFLAESVAITGAGAALGVALGLGISFLTAAIMRAQTRAPVHAAVTAETILFAAGLSILVGLVFGLYPALRAARLSPIDAIRHE